MVYINEKHMLGELAVELNLLSDKSLKDALALAADTRLPLGRVLVLSGLLGSEELENLLKCQTLIRKGILDVSLASKAIKEVNETGNRLDNVLWKYGWDPTANVDLLSLGELLVGSEAITSEKLNSVLKNQKESKLPLGHMLVTAGNISESFLSAALNVQMMLRDGKLKTRDAIAALKEVRKRAIEKDTAPRTKSFYELSNKSSPRLGELLVMAGFITEGQLIQALEQSLQNRRAIGSTLLELKLITPYELDAVINIQEKIISNNLPLKYVKPLLVGVRNGKSLYEAFEAIEESKEQEGNNERNHNFASLLKLLGLISDTALDQAWKTARENTQIVKEVVAISGLVDESALERAEHCLVLFNRGCDFNTISTAFSYAQDHQISIALALQELHITPQINLKGKKGKLSPIPTQSEVLSVKEVADELLLKGDLKAATTMFQQLAQALKRKNDTAYRACLETLVDIHCRCENYSEAEAVGLELLESNKKTYGAQSVSYGYALNTLGKVYYFDKKIDQAIKCTEEYIEVYTTFLGADNSDVACGWQNVGLLYHRLGNIPKCREAFSKALAICQKKLGENHPSTRALADKIASLPAQSQMGPKALDLSSQFITTSWKTIQLAEEGESTV